MIKIEKLADWKRSMKGFVRGVIKAKVFAATDGKVNFTVEKESDGNIVAVKVTGGDTGCSADFTAEVSTRVFNKVTPEVFTKTIEQFNKLKGFAGMTVSVE